MARAQSMKTGKLIFLNIFTLSLMVLSSMAFSDSNLISVNNKRKIFMHCEGTGSPAVIFIAGYPDRGDASWETPMFANKKTVFSEVNKFTTACDYDRPGTIKIIDDTLLKSRSDPVQQPVTAANQMDDLHHLIEAKKIHKPFILVAHSAGGLAARLYALKYPNDVAGLILIDVTNEKLLNTWSEKEIQAFYFGGKKSSKALSAHYKNVEKINFAESFKQLNDYADHKLYIPAIILTAGKIPNASQMVKDGFWPSYVTQDMAKSIMLGIHRANDLMADTFVPKARRIDVKNSGHYIQKEQPELIVKLIHTLVEQLR